MESHHHRIWRECPSQELFSGGYFFAKYWPEWFSLGIPEFIAVGVGRKALEEVVDLKMKHVDDFYFYSGIEFAEQLAKLLKEKGKPEWAGKEHVK